MYLCKIIDEIIPVNSAMKMNFLFGLGSLDCVIACLGEFVELSCYGLMFFIELVIDYSEIYNPIQNSLNLNVFHI